jgi:hypothetical protein
MRNAKMIKASPANLFLRSFGDCDMELQNISSQELSKLRNAEIQNCNLEFWGSQHGVSGIRNMQNREMAKGTILSLEDSKGKTPKSRQPFDWEKKG